MAGLKWMKTSVNVMLVLQFTAVTGQDLVVVVRPGDEVTLPCGNIRDRQVKCAGINWTILESSYSSTDLVVRGQTQSDRLRLSENCSLVLKNVSHENVGQYICRQDDTSGQQQGSAYQVDLSVVTMTEQEVGKNITLNCSVFSLNTCQNRVRWLFRGNPIGKDNGGFKTSQSGCSANVSFSKMNSNHLNNFTCEVNGSSSSNTQLFSFSPRPSGNETSTSGDKETTSDKPTGTSVSLTNLSVTVRGKVQDPETESKNTGIIVALVLAALVMMTAGLVFIIMRKRRNRNKGRNSTGNKDEDTVYYTTITDPPSCSNTVRGGDDVVIYSLANAPSDDPPHVYASIN